MSAILAPLVDNGFADATAYDTFRPSYPTLSIDKMLDRMSLLDNPGARIVEVGAGSGKLTEQLAAYEESYDIIAVEPHAHMREVLLSKRLTGVRVLNGTAEDLGAIEEAWADGVVVAQVRFQMQTRCAQLMKIEQAFHWYVLPFLDLSYFERLGFLIDARFSNIEALREIHRVTKPCGGLALIWNFEDCQ